MHIHKCEWASEQINERVNKRVFYLAWLFFCVSRSAEKFKIQRLIHEQMKANNQTKCFWELVSTNASKTMYQ